MRTLIVQGVGIFLIATGVAYWVLSSPPSGPGCPGDPEWLGYCSEVDGR